jgi:hypothetical protein
MATPEDASDALYVLLTGLAGRRLTQKDIYEAFELSKGQYYEARKDGKLFRRADRIVAAARSLDINPVELLVALVPGVDIADAVEYVEKRRNEAARLLGKRIACGSEVLPPNAPAADQLNDIDAVGRYLGAVGGVSGGDGLQEGRERA